MKLRDKPCYPVTIEYNDVRGYGKNPVHYPGLTFYEQLILALASNPAICGHEDADYDSNGVSVVRQANAIMKELEK